VGRYCFPNTFGAIVGSPLVLRTCMATRTLEAVVDDQLDIPTDAKREQLDVRNLGPPKPLKETLERLEAMDDDTVLVQFNDREPQFLYPKLIDRGYEYDTVETDKAVVTGIWKS
jgi:TusA-related sulfurtransferase